MTSPGFAAAGGLGFGLRLGVYLGIHHVTGHFSCTIWSIFRCLLKRDHRNGDFLVEPALVDLGQAAVRHHLLAGDEHVAHRVAGGAVDQVRDRVDQRLPLRPPGVEQHHVGLLAHFDRADAVCHQRSLGAVDRRHLDPGLGRHHPRVDPRLLVAAAGEPHLLRHVDDAGGGMVGADRDIDAERHQLRQLADDEIAVAVVQARRWRTDQRRLAPGQHRHLLRLEPAGMDDQHLFVEHAEMLQPFDLGEPAAGNAGVMRRIGKAGVGLQQRAVFLREPVEADDQFVGGVVEPAERCARREPWVAALRILLQHRFGALQRRCGVLDHPLGQEPQHRFGEIERGARHHHADAGGDHAFDRRLGMVVAGIDEAGDAVLEQLGRGQRRRHPDVVAVERGFVRIHAVEQERLGVGLVGEPARKLERGMQVAVDETRRHHRVAAVDGPPAGVAPGDLGRLADRDDPAAVHRNRRVANDPPLRIDGDQPGDVLDDEIYVLH